MASTDAAGSFFYSSAGAIWRSVFGASAVDKVLFGMQKMFHVILFSVFGILSGAGWENPRRRLLYLTGAVICAAAETAQWLTTSRSPSWMDGALNVACFTGGAALAQIRRAREPDA